MEEKSKISYEFAFGGLVKSTADLYALKELIKDTSGKVREYKEVFAFYLNDIKEHFKGVTFSMAGLKKALGIIKNDIVTSFKNGVSSIKTFIKSLDDSKNVLKLLKVAIAETGIGLLVIAIASLASYFLDTNEGGKIFKQGLAAIKAVVGVLIDGFAKLGEKIVWAFQHPKQMLIDLGKFLLNNLINRFTAIKVILDGIADMNFKKIGDGFIQMNTGVENSIEKMQNGSKAVGKFASSIATAAQKAADLTKQLQKNTDAQRDFNVVQKKAEGQIEVLMLKARDMHLSVKERLAAQKEASELDEKTSKRAIELAQERLDIEKQQIALKGKTVSQEDLDKQAELEEAVVELKNQSNIKQQEIENKASRLDNTGLSRTKILEQKKQKLKEDTFNIINDLQTKLDGGQQQSLEKQLDALKLANEKEIELIKSKHLAIDDQNKALDLQRQVYEKGIEDAKLKMKEQTFNTLSDLQSKLDGTEKKSLDSQLAMLSIANEKEIQAIKAQHLKIEDEKKALDIQAKIYEKEKADAMLQDSLAHAQADTAILQTELQKRHSQHLVTDRQFQAEKLQLDLDGLKAELDILKQNGQDTTDVKRQIADKEAEITKTAFTNEEKDLNEALAKRKAAITQAMADRQISIQSGNEKIKQLEAQNLQDQIALRKKFHQDSSDLEAKAALDTIAKRQAADQQIKAQAQSLITSFDNMLKSADAQKLKDLQNSVTQQTDTIKAGLKTQTDAVNEALNTQLANTNLTEQQKLQLKSQATAKLNQLNADAAAKEKKLADDLAAKKKQIAKKEADIQFGMTIAQIIASTIQAEAKTGAELGQPLALPVQIMIGVAGAAQVVAAEQQREAVQSMGTGGLVDGPSHLNGGVPVVMEGGEGVINKNSMANPVLRNFASMLNEAGGGKRFSVSAIKPETKLSDVNGSPDNSASHPAQQKVYIVEHELSQVQTKVRTYENRATF